MGLKGKYVWVILFLCFITLEAAAQEYDIKKISTNEGLPSGQIGYVQQDSMGNMWLTTYDGLIRYNGFDSEVFTVDDGLRNNIINAVFYDSRDRLWIAAESSGVGYLKADSIHYKLELASLDSTNVMYITEDESGSFYFSTYGDGLFIWDGQSFNQITTDQGLPSNYVWEIHFSKSGKTWVATQEGIAVLQGAKVEQVFNYENGLSGWSAYSFAEEKDGTLWISTSNGVTKYDGENWEQITKIDGKDLLYVYDVHVDSEGVIWIGTESDGLYWYDDSGYTHIKKENGLSSTYIYSFYEDKSGQVWVSTDENGVNIFRNRDFEMYSGRHLSGEESITVIHQQDDILWLGTDSGLLSFDGKEVQNKYVFPDELVTYKEVWDIEELPNGNLLVLNNYNKLLEFDGQNFSDYGSSISLPFMFIKDIHLKDNVLWMATESGVAKYDYRNEDYTYFTTKHGLKDNFVWSLYEDDRGEMWAATDKGVSRFDSDSLFTVGLEAGIKGTSTTFIAQSPNGKYYVGTNEGFSEFQVEDDTLITAINNFTLTPEYLPEPMFLMFDDQGSLWYGTNAGLHFFDSKTLEEAERGVIEGLFYPLQDFGEGVEFNSLSTLKENDETLWFGSYTHGLIKYSGTKPKPKNPPKPFLRGFLINGNEVENLTLGEFTFSHDRHHVMLELGAYNYEDPQRVFYEYRLNGSQENWRKVYNKTEINYTHLPPGDYSFEVRTKGIQSLWSDPVTLVSFTIEQPYWHTAWFYGLMLFLAIGILFTAVKVYLVYYEKQKLNRLVEERTNALKQALSEKDILIKEIHHRVKNNMAVISGLLDLQSWKMPEGEARNAIENSKLRLQTMSSIHEKLYQHDNLTNIDFKAFAEDLVQKVSQTLKGKDQEIEVNLDIESGKLDVHTAIPCGLILNEALSNCFEHAFTGKKKGRIDVVFYNVKSNYHLKIADNGIGIPKQLMNGKAASLGITLMRSLASQIKAEVNFDNENGTTVSFVIPIKQKDK